MPFDQKKLEVVGGQGLSLSLESEEQKIVALLHDVDEDTKWTFEDLVREGFNAGKAAPCQHGPGMPCNESQGGVG